jgi:predicted ribosome quality control (RQC) complex YloA/Tae2 family protein
MKDEDIFIREPLPKSVPVTRAPHGSKKVHYPIDQSGAFEGQVLAKCLNFNARLFSYNWSKVTCKVCWREKLETFKRMWDVPLKRLEKRRQVKAYAKQIGVKRKKGETFKDFEERAYKVGREQFEKRQVKEEKKHIKNLDCMDFTTLPLEATDLDFPLEIEELYATYDEMDTDLYGKDEVKVEKPRYVKLLKQLKKKIENQLKQLKRKKSE